MIRSDRRHHWNARLRAFRMRLDHVHICKANKAKYRLHLTIGVIVASFLAIVGTATGHDGLTHFATTANLVTCIMWIWE